VLPFAAIVVVARRNRHNTTHAIPLTAPPLWRQFVDQIVATLRQTRPRRGPRRTA
jgi:hypothetical protein